MSNILKDLSTPVLVKAIKGNRFEWYGYLGRSPKAELHDSPNLTLLLTGVPFPLMNTVIRTQLTRDKVDEVLEETVTHFKSKNMTSFSWWTEPSNRPTDLGKHLNKYVVCTEMNDSKRNISTIVFIPLFWRYKNNE